MMPETGKLHDSGQRRTFESGATRDRGDLKPRPDLISPHAQMREGMIMTLGGIKYDLRNWEKGFPISECLASAQRHIEQYKRGDTDEDHLAQARWNLGAAIHFEEEIKAGRMDSAIDDMPKYATPPDFCRSCGASIPPRMGEGTCVACDPEGCRQHQRTATEVLMDTVSEAFADPNYVGGVDLNLLPATEALVNGFPDFRRPRPEDRQIVHVPTEKIIPTFYIAGPMRGIEDYNFPAFDRARDRGKRLGFIIVSPADLDRQCGIHENSPEIKDPEYVRIIVQRDMDVLLNVLKAENGDGIAVLPGWRNSTGAMAEVGVGLWLGLKIVSARDFLSDLFGEID